MLGNLDNEVIFKKAFTDKVVFKAFVRDILGIEVEINTIEREKKFDPKISYIDFELDIFAETIDKTIGTVPNSLQKKYIVVQTLHARSVLYSKSSKIKKLQRIRDSINYLYRIVFDCINFLF